MKGARRWSTTPLPSPWAHRSSRGSWTPCEGWCGDCGELDGPLTRAVGLHLSDGRKQAWERSCLPRSVVGQLEIGFLGKPIQPCFRANARKQRRVPIQTIP